MSSKVILANSIEKLCLFRMKQMRLLNEGSTNIPAKCVVCRPVEMEMDGTSLETFINKRIKAYKLPIIICKSIINNNINENINRMTIERFNQELFELMDITRELVEKNILNEHEYLLLCGQYKKDKQLLDNLLA